MRELSAVVAVMSVQPTSAKRTERQLSSSAVAAGAVDFAGTSGANHRHMANAIAAREVTEFAHLAPIRRFLHIENGFDVLQMIDGKLSVAAPLLLGHARDGIGNDAQLLARCIAGHEGLGRPLEVIQLVK